MIKVGFICVHNSCRSQIAEALGKHLASNFFKSYSAGTHTKDRMNPDAVRIVKDKFNIDMEQSQHPKILSDIPELDIAITMGCNVNCPWLPCKHKEDWGLDDPTGKSDDEFYKVIDEIERKILELIKRLPNLI
ncbi:MAG: arsenate reductase ArsC [Defluviitaleaceae bacterium]|nr:arsenate reductase ArsC [Defluviitaleaceae bacterium]